MSAFAVEVQARSGAARRGKGPVACCVGMFFVLIVSLAVLVPRATALAPNPDLASGPSGSPERQGGTVVGPVDDLALPQGADETRIAGHYIVVLQDSVGRPGRLAHIQTKQGGGELGFVYHSALKGYSAQLSKGAVEALREDPRVKYVSPDRRIEIAQTTPTGIQRTLALANPELDIDETDDVRINADVAVIDTGIDFEHPDLNVVERTNCVPTSEDPEEESSTCVDKTGTDGNGHGSHVAGIVGAIDNGLGVVGVAPGVRLWSVRALSSAGVGDTSWLVAAVDWVTAHASQIEVANMSITCACSMPALDEAIKASVKVGVVYVVAAGNSTADAKDYSPANNPNVITVSALADYDGLPGGKVAPGCQDVALDDTSASFSNYGKDVDIAAPGVCIFSTSKGKGYATLSGTSMASPYVAGAAAIIAAKENPENMANVEAIRSKLIKNGNSEWTDNSGDGVKEPLLDVGAIFTEQATIASESKATLHGRVNPSGLATTYRFEYGTSTSYGTNVPTSGKSVGTGTDYVAVSEAIEGLKKQTTYHYRVTTTNSKGTFYGSDQIFATTPPVVGVGVASPSSHRATLKATVNPAGASANYFFEYGPTISYGSKVFFEGKDTSVGTTAIEVAEQAEELNANTTYHFRLVAKNTAGTAFGGDATFTTADPIWKAQLLPQPPESAAYHEANGVSCMSSEACVSVGASWSPGLNTRVTLAEIWNGKAWSAMSTPNPSGLSEGSKFNRFAVLRGVSCPSSSACVAVGYYRGTEDLTKPVAMSWNGSAWTTMSVSPPSGANEAWLEGVSCSSSSACAAVGSYKDSSGVEKALAMGWNGSKWSTQSTPSPSGAISTKLRGVSCSTSSACMAVGEFRNSTNAENSLGMSWNGSTWTVQSTPSPAGSQLASLYGVSCSASNACTAVGYNKLTSLTMIEGMALRWNGSEWKAQSTSGLTPGKESLLQAVSCTAASTCLAVGYYFNVEQFNRGARSLTYRWDGSSWTAEDAAPMSTPSGWWHEESLQATSCSAAYCVAVGRSVGAPQNQNSQILAFSEQTVKPPKVSAKAASNLSTTQVTLNASINPQGLTTNYYFEYGPTDSYGQKAPVEAEGIGSGTKDVEVSQAVKGLEEGGLYHFRAVASNSDGTIYGKDGVLVVPFLDWASDPPNGYGSLSGVSCATDSACVAVGQGGSTGSLGELFNGKVWTAAELPVPAGATWSDLTAVSCSSASFCFAVGRYTVSGSNQLIFSARYDGEKWTVLSTPKPIEDEWASLDGVSCVSSTSCVAVGRSVKWVEGGKSLVEHPLTEVYNGEKWSIVSAPEPVGVNKVAPLMDVSCASSSYCMAVGYYYGSGTGLWATKFDGSKWTTSSLPVPSGSTKGALLGVSCTSTTACTAVGRRDASTEPLTRPLAERYDGKEWSSQTIPNFPEGKMQILTSVSCKSATQCNAAGGTGSEIGGGYWKIVTAAWDGTGWSFQSTDNPMEGKESSVGANLEGVSCSSASRCTAVGWRGTPTSQVLIERFNVPVAITKSATELKDVQATVNAKVNPRGVATSYYFEYGKTTAYGSKVPISPKSVGSGTSNVSVSETISGLTAVTTYHYRVVAEGGGWTTMGVDATLTTNTTTPPKATTKTATKVEASQATLSGTVNPQGTATSYYFEYGKTTAYGTKVPISPKSVGSGTSDISVSETISGLTAVTTYHYRVVAEGGGWTIPGADSVLTTATVPPKATTKTATKVEAHEATLNADVNPEGTATSYYFEYGKTTAYGTKVPISPKSVGSGTSNVSVSETISGLESGTTYHYRAVAKGGIWTISGVDETLVTNKAGPKATTKPATYVKTPQATLNGVVNPEGTATSYYFEYGKTTAYGTKVPISPKSVGSGTSNVSVSETISGLESGTTYHYRVVAEDGVWTISGADETLTPSATMTLDFAFGSQGAGDGQFTVPSDIAVNSEGSVWVVDSGLNRVQKFNSNGVYLTKFGSTGSGNGQFSQSGGIAIDSEDDVWIVDGGNCRVQEFDPEGGYLEQIDFEFVEMGEEEEGCPVSDIAIDAEDDIWVLGYWTSTVRELNPEGEVLTEFGSFGTGVGQFSYPTGIAVDFAGNVWVAAGDRVQKFDAEGKYLTKFGSAGSGNGQFSLLDGIAVDAEGKVWAVDWGNGRIQGFNSKGEYFAQFGSAGKGSGQFTHPTGIAADSSGNLWVVDTGGTRVQKLTP
jgi:subtilisin family serine protease/sugar lactone lactonase YvrE